MCVSFVFINSASCQEAAQRGLFVTVLQEPQVLSIRKEMLGLIDFVKKTHVDIFFRTGLPLRTRL
jgi:hypothetical protein